MPEQSRTRSTLALIIVVITIIVLAAGGYYAWITYGGAQEAPAATPETPVVVNDTTTYASSTLGISITYPKTFIANEAYTNTEVNPRKPIGGVKFTIPMQMATGTNLSADSGISVEWLPRAKVCTSDIYLSADVKIAPFIDGGVTYSLATSSNAGAGNMYEEIVYAVASSTPCTAIRYFIHSTQIDNYPVGTVRAFDRAALIAEFDKIRRSLVLQ